MEMRPTRHFCENWLATLALSSRAVGQVLFLSCNSFYGLRGDERFAHGGPSESMILWIAETFNGQPLYSHGYTGTCGYILVISRNLPIRDITVDFHLPLECSLNFFYICNTLPHNTSVIS